MTTIRQASLDFLKGRTRDSILIVSNCQTYGIVHAMQGATSEFEIFGLQVSQVIGQDDAYYISEFGEFAHLFVASQMQQVCEIPELEAKTRIIPTVYFDGYHPDLIYVSLDGAVFDSPIGDYHSCITYTAFQLGCSAEETESFFNERFYHAVGYFEQWQIAKTAMFEQYSALGLSVEDHFYRWSGQGAFMHTSNHPKLGVLADLAFDLLAGLGCEFDRNALPINDGLGDGPLFPIYPEIAALTGTQGSYRFKPIGTNERLSLRDFIGLSFAAYAAIDPKRFAVPAFTIPRVEACSRAIREQRGS